MAAKFFFTARRKNYSQFKTVEGSLSAIPRPHPTSPAQFSAWYFGELPHGKAEELLSRPGLRSGTFLVRKSSSCPGSLALSLLHQGKVFHYLIIGDNGGGVYVGLTNEKKVFNTMEELIGYYRCSSHFLVCKLTDVCPKPVIDSPRQVTEIDRSSLVLRERLSSSGSDDVWYGTWFHGEIQLPVHVRRLSPQLHSKADVMQETDMTHRFLHRNVVQLYGVSTIKEPMYIVSECLGNGSLLFYLREGGGRCITFGEKIDMAVQVACGIDYLHSQLCVHRHICAKNVFLSEANVPKIANFRYAKMLPREKTILKLPVEELHTRWSPPEVLESGHFSTKSDIWSFGVLLTEVLTNGKLPYAEVECREQLKWMVVHAHYRIPRSQLIDCPEPLYEVLCSCWRSEPSLRPKFEFIITGMLDCIPLDDGHMSTLH